MVRALLGCRIDADARWFGLTVTPQQA